MEKTQRSKGIPVNHDFPIDEGIHRGKIISGSYKKLNNGEYSIKFVVETHNKYGTRVILTDYFVMSEHPNKKLYPLSLSMLSGLKGTIRVQNCIEETGPVSHFEIIEHTGKDVEEFLFGESILKW